LSLPVESRFLGSFRSIIFILGLFIFGGGVWGLRYAKNLKLEDLIPTPEAVEFARQAQLTTPYFTYLLVGLIVAVTLFQMPVGIGESRVIAGLEKSDFWQRGEYCVFNQRDIARRNSSYFFQRSGIARFWRSY
jgi:hypothetical protein